MRSGCETGWVMASVIVVYLLKFGTEAASSRPAPSPKSASKLPAEKLFEVGTGSLVVCDNLTERSGSHSLKAVQVSPTAPLKTFLRLERVL